jgi:hypothetical protein
MQTVVSVNVSIGSCLRTRAIITLRLNVFYVEADL